MGESRTHQITYQLFEGREALAADEAALLEAAMDATEFSYAPFSRFRVGCALLLEGGEVIQGNNQENIAFPSGLCAERVALFAAGAAGKAGAIQKIAIRARSELARIAAPPSSCGACRQVMAEYERMAGHPFVVLMQGEEGQVLRVENVRQSLLPFNFELKF